MKAVIGSIGWILLASTLSAQDGGLDIMEGETIYDGGILLVLSDIYRHYSETYSGSHRVSDPASRVRQDHRITLSGNYGLLPELQLSLLVPYILRELRLDTASGRTTLSSDGIGDIAAFAKARPWKQDWYLGSFNWSVIGGLELPTGSTSERDGGARLAPELQPGSGSVNGILATAGTLEVDRWKFTALFLYQIDGEGARAHKFGDVFVAEVVVRNRLVVEPFPGPLFAVEMTFQWRQEWFSETDSIRIPNTGEERFTLKPTLLFYPRAWWGIETWAEIPVYRRVEGTQLGLDYGVFLALIYRL